MAKSILIVEGWDDKVFFESLIQKSFVGKPDDLSLDVVVGHDKTQAKDMLRIYVRQSFVRIGIARDLDNDSPQEEERHIRDNLASELKSPVKVQKGFLLAGESRVIAIPMGLYMDAELKSLGITRSEMEDYLVKLVLRERPEHLEEILPVLKKCGLERSKQFLQPFKALFRFSDDDHAFARFLIQRSDKATIAEIMSNVITKVETLVKEI